MALEADMIADRRSLRRRISLWRALAAVSALVAVLVVGYVASGGSVPGTTRDQIARFKIEGLITGDQRTLDLIKSVREASSVRAAIVEISSPGGTVTGSEAVYDALRLLAQAKPTVAVVDGLAASGGYIAAIATDRIVARQTSLVGSIGVLFQMPNASRLLDTLGIKVEAIRSTPLKAAPSGFEPTSDAARAALQRVVDDNYRWFQRLVSERRKIEGAALTEASDGRIHSGTQALAMKLIDDLGAEPQAISWLEKERGVPAKLPVRPWKRRSEADQFGLWSSLARLAQASGWSTAASVLVRAGQLEAAQTLDGALALWQPVIEK